MCRRKWLNYANFDRLSHFWEFWKQKQEFSFLLTIQIWFLLQNPLPSFPFLRMSLSLPFFQTIFVFLQLFHFHFIWYAFIFSIFSLYLQQSESILELFDLFVNHFSFLNGLSFFFQLHLAWDAKIVPVGMNVSGKASLSLFAFFLSTSFSAFSFPMPDKRSVCLKVGCECNTVTIKRFKIR